MSKSKLKFLDIGLWLGVALITLAAIAATHFAGLSGPIVAIVWILWLLVALVCAYFTEKGQMGFEFFKDSKAELEKVVWPNKQETTQTTLIVVVMVTVSGVILWGVDSGMTWAIGKLTQLG